MTTVSIVIPVHNRAGSIGRAIRSVLAQDGPDLEVVVVDDGSTDGTADAVREVAREDPRVVLIGRGGRGGAQAARNTGIRVARGEWIAFLDSDDEWLPGSISSRLAEAAARNAPVVHSECLVVRGPGEPPEPFGIPALAGDVHADLLRAPGPAFPALLVRREALAGIGELDEGLVSYQEWDTAIRLARRHPFAFVTEPTFVYHRRSGGTISSDRDRQARGYEQVVGKHRRAIVRRLGRGWLAQHCETAARLYEAAGDAASRRRCLLAAIRVRPFGRSVLRRLSYLARPFPR